jgi:hypothetical protein
MLTRTPALLALNDAQLQMIMNAAQPLSPNDRVKFLQEIAERRSATMGDGELYRACRELQRRYFPVGPVVEDA